jgi:hypothetical protein
MREERQVGLLAQMPQHCAVDLHVLHPVRLQLARLRNTCVTCALHCNDTKKRQAAYLDEDLSSLRVVHLLEVCLPDLALNPPSAELLPLQALKHLNGLLALVLRQEAHATAKGLQQRKGRLCGTRALNRRQLALGRGLSRRPEDAQWPFEASDERRVIATPKKGQDWQICSANNGKIGQWWSSVCVL